MSDIYDQLDHFSRHEFGPWADQMSERQLRCLDAFRSMWGAKVKVSPAEGAVGRHGSESTSKHNVDRWGEVRATDVFPEGLRTQADARRAIRCAEEAGFTGIGIYPEWEPSVGMHLDTRDGEHVAKWGFLDTADGGQRMVAQSQAIGRLPA